MNLLIISLSILFIIELVYFKIAEHFNIIDKPNERSSHTKITLRGGGIIFPASVLIYAISTNFQMPYFVIGLALISIISFVDDINPTKASVRFVFHFSSVILLLFQLQVFAMPWWVAIIAIVFVIGVINAYNFLDGINGITGAYSLVTMGTLYYLNTIANVFENDFLTWIIASLVVFSFFNFRKKAKCFAGDVGSVSIAFCILFIMGGIYFKTQNLLCFLLLTVYGIDAVITIGQRLLKGENIFEAHRSHLYQYLANEAKWPHMVVAGMYALVQIAINVLVVLVWNSSLSIQIGVAVSIALVLVILYGMAKLYLIKKYNL